MKISRWQALIVLATLSFSCTMQKNQDNTLLDYEIVSLEYQTSECEPERDACLLVSLDYPVFTKGDSVAKAFANRIIVNSTLDFMGMGDVEAAIPPPLSQAVVDLDSSFQHVKRDFGTATGWMAELHTREVYRNDSILVLEANSMAYLGGAHGQYNTRYLNFYRKSGRLVPMAAFVELDSFKAEAEKAFRAKYLKEGQTYLDAGFSFLGGTFVLPANYAFKGDSILLHYNHYEIAPYAAGQFDVAVPIN